MLLVLVFILLLIGAAVVGSIYSNFLVFYSSFHESENYHKAYYSSISALERAELVTKQRSPGYNGSGGWIMGEKLGKGSPLGAGQPNTNGLSDGIIGDFSYLSNKSNTDNTSTVFRSINSRTTRIPKTSEGDIESMLSYINEDDPYDPENSDNFNMMDYKDSQVFLLYYDKSELNPYTKTSGCSGDTCVSSQPETITGTIRLPLYMKSKFGDLQENKSLTNSHNAPKNDPIVDRQIRGQYKKNDKYYPFTIFSTQRINTKNNDIVNNYDNTIRESDINCTSCTPVGQLNFEFGSTDSKYKMTPLGKSRGTYAGQSTVISQQENDIKTESFHNILNNSTLYTNKQLRFSLLNLLETDEGIYPFLEYYADFGTEISDKYFTINAEGNYDDYRINIIVRKPTIKESVLGSFTTIF